MKYIVYLAVFLGAASVALQAGLTSALNESIYRFTTLNGRTDKIIAGDSKNNAASDEIENAAKNISFIKVYINKISNTLSDDCSLNGLELPAERAIKPRHPLLIPFISISSYLTKYTSRKAYVPEEALKLQTPYGQFLLWASESGVMYAQDPEDAHASIDTWQAEKLMGITCEEHGGKKLYLASLILKAIKDKVKKEKIELLLRPLR